MLERVVSRFASGTKLRVVEVPRAAHHIAHVGKVHGLEDNLALTRAEHEYCVGVVSRVQQLYDGALAYLDSNGLDRALYLPGNEWGTIVPAVGMRFRNTYNDINFLRLIGPFSGFHMSILDRLDEIKFPAEWSASFVSRLVSEGIPDDIAKKVRDLYNPEERLRPCLAEYNEHIFNVPQRYVVRTPRMFGEMGIDVDGVLANPDVILSQSRINGMLSAGILDKLDDDIAKRGKARVLEIGSGHGGLAYALRSIFGDELEYICIDLPSSLYHAALYLSVLAGCRDSHVYMPGDALPQSFKYVFAANHCTDELFTILGEGTVDLAVNCMSFPEMTAGQVRYYGELFKRVLRLDGAVFDENLAIKAHHTDNKAIFDDIFGYRKRVASDAIKTKNWCQDVWSSRYLGKIFDASDKMLLRRP